MRYTWSVPAACPGRFVEGTAMFELFAVTKYQNVIHQGTVFFLLLQNNHQTESSSCT